jgi:hypothetical protein
MNLTKQYIIQCISNAANSLRLSTQKIEVVALLRELISKSENLESDIKKMKTITQFSTLAIRLNEIHSFLSQEQVEMSRISEKFKEHSQLIIKDLGQMLDLVNPSTFKEGFDRLYGESEEGSDGEINVDLSKRDTEDISFEDEDKEREELKEEIIMEEEKEEDNFFQNYESSILEPIKPLDNILKNLAEGEADEEEIISFADTLEHNAEISGKAGFEIIANMHKIVAKSLRLIKSGELKPEKYVIESMRACLIVIVAVVRGKEVDITNYLNRAEEFGESIEMLKVKEDI